MKPIIVVVLTILFTAFLLGVNQAVHAGPCRDQNANKLIEQMGPLGAAAFCPEWEWARQEYNVRRDVPTIPVPQGEYRVRLRSTDRR